MSFFVAVMGSFCSCGLQSSGVIAFVKHDKEYYAKIAGACDVLLSQSNSMPGETTIRGDDKILPAALFDLHATKIEVINHIEVNSNKVSQVLIVFGEGRPDFTISWAQNEYRNGYKPWELSAVDEDEETVVFATTNLSTELKIQ